MTSDISIVELARSLELYQTQKRLQALHSEGKHTLTFIREPFFRKRKEVDRAVIAFGSYDPFTVGHGALFLCGLQNLSKDAQSTDELTIVTSTAHFEKQIDFSKNSSIYDRIHAQEGFASCYQQVSLAFFNDPLFINLKRVLESPEGYGRATALYFLVGADVMEKIVDRKGYERFGVEMNPVVNELFEHHFIVADRKVTYKDGREARMLDKQSLISENPILTQYADRIIGIDLAGDYASLEVPIEEVSSTLIRNRRKMGGAIDSLVEVGISDFVEKRSLYLEDPTAYEAFVCLRQMYVDHFGEKPIGEYIDQVMAHMHAIQGRKELQREVIQKYDSGEFFGGDILL